MQKDNCNKQNTKSERVKQFFAETAKEMILEGGIESVSVREVAHKAGYSFATIYNHFKNIDELLWYTRNILISDIAEYMENSNQKVVNVDGVKKLFRTYIDYFIKNPNVYRFFFFHHLDKSSKISSSVAEGTEFNKKFQDTFDFLVKSGNYSFDEIPKIIKALIFSVHGLLTMYISDNDDIKLEDVYKDLDGIISLLINDV